MQFSLRRTFRTTLVSSGLALGALEGCAQLIGAEFEGATLGVEGGAFASDSPATGDASNDHQGDGATAFDARVGDLVFWVAADRGVVDGGPPEGGADGAVLVPTWRDQSGNARDLSQSIIAKQPLLVENVQGGLPAMRFQRERGTCYGSTWLGPPGVAGTTAFIVTRGVPTSLIRFQGPSAGYLVFPWNSRDYDLDASPDFFFLVSSGGDSSKIRIPFVEGEWTLAVARLAVGKIGGMQVFKNGVLLESSSIFADAAPAPGGFQVGCAPGQLTEFMNADVAEIMIYGTALSDLDRIAVEGYLKAKWSLRF